MYRGTRQMFFSGLSLMNWASCSIRAQKCSSGSSTIRLGSELLPLNHQMSFSMPEKSNSCAVVQGGVGP